MTARRRHPRARPTGFTLIETLAALMIVGIGVFAILSVGIAGARAVSMMRLRETHLESADELMRVATLWPRADLDRHLGDRHEGPFVLTIRLVATDVYQISIRDSASTDASPLLISSTYREPAQ